MSYNRRDLGFTLPMGVGPLGEDFYVPSVNPVYPFNGQVFFVEGVNSMAGYIQIEHMIQQALDNAKSKKCLPPRDPSVRGRTWNLDGKGVCGVCGRGLIFKWKKYQGNS